MSTLLAVLALALPASLSAQAVTGQAGAEGTDGGDDEVVMLDPFLINAEEDAGSYAATSSLAGTRLRTDLKDVASAIQVVTQKFLTDTNSKNSADLLVYTTNTEVTAVGGTYVGLGDGAILADGSLIEPVPNTRIRGLAAADNLRDFFLTDIPWDSYNVGRVDLQRGPNSILFGIGSPAGIINSAINTAGFNDSNTVVAQVGSFGSYRGSIDLNKVLVTDELSVRVAGLYDQLNYKQDPANRNDQRLFAAVRWEPGVLKKNGMRTSFRANIEDGKIDGINPRYTPPMDSITPWFNNLNKATYDWQDSSAMRDAAGASFNPFIGAAGSRIWDGQVVTFDHDSPRQLNMFGADVKNYPTDPTGVGNNTVNGSYQGIASYNNIGSNLRLPGWQINPYKAKSLTDPTIFDFHNNLIDGENRSNSSDFTAYNLNLSQTFLDNQIGIELAWDHQDASWQAKNFMAWDAAAISVDIMNTFADGSPNPNVGRPMVIGGGGSSGSSNTDRSRDSYRITAFAELDFEKVLNSETGLAKILGRHVFTGNLSYQAAETESQNWYNWYTGEGYAPTADQAVRQASRDAITVTYLGGPITGSNASGLNLPRITAIQAPVDATITQWNTAANDGAGGFIDYQVPIVNPNAPTYGYRNRPYTQASKDKSEVDSAVLVWQGFFLDDAIIPLVGYRQDTAKAYNAGAPSYTLGIVNNFNDPEWRLPNGPLENNTGANGEREYNEADGSTTSWGIVARLPRSIVADLPYNLDVGVFYNESSNFQPDASRKDVLGNPIPSPTGETQDYGFTVSALNGKVSFKANWYETKVKDATLDGGGITNAYMIGAGEAWAQSAAVKIQADLWQWPASDNFGTSSSGAFLRWEPPTSGRVDPSQPFNLETNPYTQEAIDAQYAAQQASVQDWLANPPPEGLKRTWGLSDWDAGSGSWSSANAVISGDTVSSGLEMELTANPVAGWQISMNASQTEAQRLNIGAAYTSWMELRHEQLKGPMGDIRIWGGGNGALDPATSGTIRSKMENEAWAGYKLATALDGANVPELREWRFNFITNYDFQEGALKGANVGGSWRYVDANVTGYPLNSAGDGYDVTRPYYGGKEGFVDVWAGYAFPIFDDKVNWRIQLNVRNIFGSDDLVKISVQPDGSPAQYKISEPMTWSLTNTFEF